MSSAFTLKSSASDAAIWIQTLTNGLHGMTFKVKHAVFCESSPFQKVEVFDSYGFGRVLMLAGNLVLTEKDEFIYSEMMAHPALLMHPQPRRVCVIGGGDGAVTREVLRYPGVEQVVIVEIDSLVVKAVRTHFPTLGASFDDKRVSLAIEDGCRYLEKNAELFDVILVDSYAPGGPVESIVSEPFYELVASRLGPKGVAVFQTESPTLLADHARVAVRNISAAFAEYRPFVCSVPSYPGGICSFVAAARAKGALDGFDEERCRAVTRQCRCYSKEAHEGAFKLPKYVRETMG